MLSQRVKQHGSTRNYHLKRRYGLTEQDVAEWSRRHGNRCLICLRVLSILCGDCNTGMGQFRDDPGVLRRAIAYLTGGLYGLLRTASGAYEVAVLRPRTGDGAVDAGWELGRACTDDLAYLHALAYGDSGEPWATDAAEPMPCVQGFPPLDLSAPVVEEPWPDEPAGLPEQAVLTH